MVSDSGNTMEDGLRLILWILVGIIIAPGKINPDICFTNKISAMSILIYYFTQLWHEMKLFKSRLRWEISLEPRQHLRGQNY